MCYTPSVECPKCGKYRDSAEIWPDSGGVARPCKICRLNEKKNNNGKIICRHCGMKRDPNYKIPCPMCQRMRNQEIKDRRKYQRDLEEMGIIDRRRK